ncbi:MAG: TIGR03557 family F420-dependent LLM class oxidoreductase [Actinomycetota bacterium]|nr:TIGR03557 family F420-dependent LLM class oxidoreductase [Actinomycetota bacterium]
MELVGYARRAEEVGFSFALISDHYHPWTNRQGQSPFVWCVIGAIAEATERLRLGTGVTCPTVRIHPAIVAQAAATAATMLPGRFFLGLGSGENLNEHILGDRWPRTAVRHEMLEEAVALIRRLWDGGNHSHRGTYYTLENARVYTLPEQPPPILVAASGTNAAELAGRVGDGLIATTPDPDLVGAFAATGGSPRPRYAELKVCWADTEAEALRQAHTWWPNLAVPGELGQELPTPEHFEQTASLVREDDIGEAAVCGPDPDRHVAGINAFLDAGFDHICVHQVSPDQAGFFRFYEREVLPRLR